MSGLGDIFKRFSYPYSEKHLEQITPMSSLIRPQVLDFTIAFNKVLIEGLQNNTDPVSLPQLSHRAGEGQKSGLDF